MRDILKILPANVKETAKAASLLIVVIILFILVGNFGISKIIDLKRQITDAERNEATLTEKLSILQSFSQSSDSINAAAVAIPKANPSVIAISQLRSIAARDSVNVASIKSSSSTAVASGLSYVSTTFQASGPRDVIITFLKDMENIAPITRIDKVSLSESGGLTMANIITKTYWAPYPKAIPSVGGAITDLTPLEKQVLSQVSGLIQPAFSEVTPSENGVNPAPFGQ